MEVQKCEHCGKQSDDVQYRADPFIEEINGETLMEWICDDCYQQSYDDI